ncbi:DNA repair protein RecO [Planctomycetota bacterium]
MLSKDQAICIRTVDYSETSQIVTLFARSTGKLSAIAKGSKRPRSSFDGPLEILSFGNIVFSCKDEARLATLTEFQHKPLYMSGLELLTLNCSLFGAELVNAMTDEHDPHPELFDSFVQFLRNLHEQEPTENKDAKTVMLLILFQLSLLKEVGLGPVLNVCNNCKTGNSAARPKQMYFSSSANGLICRDCESSFADTVRLSPEAAKCLINLQTIVEANTNTLEEIEKILIGHFTELLGQVPKMAKYVGT